MANIRLFFYGTNQNENTRLECFCNASNEISIFIEDVGHSIESISLNKETAIRLSRELRKQIALID